MLFHLSCIRHKAVTGNTLVSWGTRWCNVKLSSPKNVLIKATVKNKDLPDSSRLSAPPSGHSLSLSLSFSLSLPRRLGPIKASLMCLLSPFLAAPFILRAPLDPAEAGPRQIYPKFSQREEWGNILEDISSLMQKNGFFVLSWHNPWSGCHRLVTMG